MDPDADTDPAILVIDFQDANKKIIKTQQVLNRQIGSLKSSQFQKFFSQGKH
jgi:hypothetical protein